jgi:futalosine hydrolase
MEPELRKRRPLIDLLVCVSTELEGALLRDLAPLLVTGIGSVNAAYSLTKFLSQQEVKRVIVCGIGGAYPQSGLTIGDVVCAERECYGDLGADSPEGFLDMKALGLPVENELRLQIFPMECRVPFVTVNTCTGTDARAFAMRARTGGAIENMEGAAIAHVAGLSGIPVGEIRGVSNIAGKRDRTAWKIKEAAEAAQRALLRWLATASGVADH